MASFGGAVKLTGESEYRAALRNITQNLKEVSSELKLVSSQYDKNDTSIEALTAKQNVLTHRLEEQKSKLSTLREQYEKMGSEYQQNKDKHEQLISSYNKEKSELERIGRELGTTSPEYKKQAEVVDNLKEQVEKSTLANDQNERSVSRMRTQMNNAQTDINKTKSEIKELESQMGKSATSSGKLGKSVEDAGEKARRAEGGFTVLKGAIANIAGNIVTSAINGIKELATSAFNAGSDFESGMSKVGAISGATGDDLDALRDKAKEMGASTKFTATESAEAFQYMAMAGWKTSDMLDGISGVMNLAAASGEDLGEVSDIVTDALTAMGYSAGDAGHFADVLASASSNSNTNVGMMGNTFQYVAPIAGALGYSIEDTATAIGLMANAGIKGEQAGTSLRSVLTRLSSPPKECADAMKALGISMTNADGTMRPLSDVMGQLREKFNGLSESQQTQYAKAIAGQEAMSGLLAIVNASPDDYQKLTDSINDCSGAAEDMANTMNDNVSGQITLLKSKVEGIMIKIFDDASGKIREAIDKISDALDSVDWDSVGEKIGDAIGKAVDVFKWILDNAPAITSSLVAISVAFTVFKTASAIGSVVEMFQKLTTAIKGAEAAQIALNASQIANPIGLIIGAIAGLVAGIIVLWNTNDDFRNAVMEIWQGIQDFVGNAIQAIGDFFSNLGDTISQLPQMLADWLNDAIETVSEWVSNFAQQASDAGSQFVDNITSFVQSLPYNIGYLLGTVIGTVVSWVTDMASNAASAGSQFVQNAISFIQNLPQNIANFLSNVISNVSSWVSNMGSKARSAGSTFVSNVVSFVQNLPGKIGGFLSNIIGRLGSWAGEMASKGRDGAKRLFDAVVNGIASLPSKVGEIGKNIVQGLWNGISGAAGWLAGKVKSFATGILDGMKSAMGIHSPSTVFRDQVGKYLAEGIGVGFENEMGNVAKQMQDAMPDASMFSIDGSMTAVDYQSSGAGFGGNDGIVDAVIEALGRVHIVLDDEVAGKFVERTVTNAIYA